MSVRWQCGLCLLVTLSVGCSDSPQDSHPDAAEHDAHLDRFGPFDGTTEAGREDGTVDTTPLDFGAFAETPEDVAAVKQEQPTPEQLGIYIPLGAELVADGATVRYRLEGTASWREAHPLLRIRPDWNAPGAPVAPADALAGTIFDLSAGATYQIEITLQGGTSKIFRRVMTTRPLPATAGTKTISAGPSDDLQATFDGLEPGDVLELSDGSYALSRALQIKVSGTPSEPIYIRGASRQGVVIKANAGMIIQILEASHVVLENLTLEGSGVDSGTAASSKAVSFWNGAKQTHITLRELEIKGVDMGIVGSAALTSVLVYDCRLEGNNEWTEPFLTSNLTWNDDGLRLPGEGNCAFNNTLHGFGDAFAVTNGVFSAAVYFYRNRVTMTGDDAFEGDYGTRNLGFYDNSITNSATFLSLDPLWGGPLYCFRNIVINTSRGPFKLNDTNSGFLIYNNTIIRTQGKFDWASVQFNNGALRGWSYRNNLLHYRGSGELLALESAECDPIDVTHNAWYPDGKVTWTSSGGGFESLAAAKAGLPATTPLFSASTQRHQSDVLMGESPFVEALVLGADYLTMVESRVVPTLHPTSAVKHAGVPIAGVTDGFSGDAPDIGAVIEGRAQTAWGVRW
ncbi:MAG: hypothetical protein JRH20_29720 [Deltaproteobacteria bacterium]|nr:hypothetical protein [Deltaproteobacteria bacterium]